jgi:Rad3-related DNA helicases
MRDIRYYFPQRCRQGNDINQEEMEHMIDAIEEIQGARDSFLSSAISMEHAFHEFFTNLNWHLIKDDCSKRLSIRISDDLLKTANAFKKTLNHLLMDFQIEQELYMESLSANQIQAYEGQIERATIALEQFCRNKGVDIISWVDGGDGSFWVVPRNLSELLNKKLYQKEIPVVFTSATLSNEGDFDYFIRTIGLKNVTKSTVGSPFDLENQVVVYMNPSSNCKKMT